MTDRPAAHKGGSTGGAASASRPAASRSAAARKARKSPYGVFNLILGRGRSKRAKALLELLITDISGLQFWGHETRQSIPARSRVAWVFPQQSLECGS